MKNILIFCLFICSLFFSTKSYSQVFIPGIKAGYNISSFQSDQFESLSLAGIDVGLNFTSKFGKGMHLITELTYSQKGAHVFGRIYFNDKYSNQLKHKLSVNSINFSALGNFFIKNPNFSIQLGPVIGLSNKASLEGLANEIFLGDEDYILNNINVNHIISEIENGMDFSLAFGVSGGTESLRFNIRYLKGLKNYYKAFNYSRNSYEVSNNVLQFSAAYTLNNLIKSQKK